MARPSNWVNKSPILNAPVKIDGIHIQDLWISPQDDKVFIDQKTTMKFLKQILNENEFSKLLAIESPNNYLEINEFKKYDIKVIFDPNELIIYFEIPIQLRKENFITLKNRGLVKGEIIEPNQFSYYLNFDYQNSYLNEESNSENMYNELNLNYSGNILNISGFTNSDNRKRYFRDQAQFIKDFKKQNTRLIIGDLVHSTVDLQEQIAGAGITIQNDFSINPKVLKTNYNKYELNLKSPSKVEIFLNNNKIYTGFHPAGLLNLTKLPLIIGLNQIQVYVTDQSGRREKFEFGTNYHNNLLPYNISDYSLNFYDQSSTDDEGDLEYDKEKRFFSGYYRKGINDKFTIGVNHQGDHENNLSGVELTSGYGGFLTEFYYTHSKADMDYSNSYLIGFQNMISNTSLKPIRFNASYRFFEENFKFVSGTLNNTKIAKNLSSSYLLNSATSIGLGLENTIDYSENENEYINLELLYRFGINANLSIKSQVDVNESNNNSVLITFNWFEKSRSFSGYHSYNEKDKKLRNQLNYNKQLGSKHLHLAATHEKSDELELEKSTIYSNFETNSGSIRIDHSDDQENRYANLNLRFAFVGANSRPYLAPYITNSFLIVESDSPNNIYIGNNNAGDISKDSSFIFHNLTAYRTNTIPLNLDQLELGEDLDFDRLTVMPENKTGSFFKIKTNRSNAVQFRLVHNKDPMIVRYKPIVFEGDKNTYEVVTGKKGLVFIPNVAPGNYEVKFNDLIIKNVAVEEKTGLINLGKIYVD